MRDRRRKMERDAEMAEQKRQQQRNNAPGINARHEDWNASGKTVICKPMILTMNMTKYLIYGDAHNRTTVSGADANDCVVSYRGIERVFETETKPVNE